jgi:hypothetical protein
MALRDLQRRIGQGRFRRGMALLAGYFALVSAVDAYFEHRRGSFNQRWMWTPILLTAPLVAAAARTATRRRPERRVLALTSGTLLVDGLLGFYLHVRGIARMPGHLRNLSFNVTAGPPLFAPLLFAMAGLLGLAATLFREEEL